MGELSIEEYLTGILSIIMSSLARYFLVVIRESEKSKLGVSCRVNADMVIPLGIVRCICVSTR